MSGNRETGDEFDSSDYMAASAEYGRTLRTWLVAYGVGGPLIFLTQPAVAETVRSSGRARNIVYLFLTGVALQVCLAVWNKWLTWYVAEALTGPEGGLKWRHRTAFRLHRMMWIDLVCDVGAVLCFGWATMEILLIYT